MQDHQNDSSEVSFCPSFNSYSSGHLAETAARVRQEEEEQSTTAQSNQQNEDKDDDFEFVLVPANPENDDSVNIINGNGEFFPVFPVFNRDLLLDHHYDQDQQRQQQHHLGDFDGDVASPIRFSLENLFVDDRDPPSSSSSSEADELEGVPPGTYCVWKPKSTASPSPSPGRCKKSNSTGSSSSSSKPRRGWRLRDLLRRSRSDGEKTLVFLDQNNNISHESKLGKKREEEKGEKGESTVPVKTKAKEKVSAHEVFYVKSKALKEGDKRKSYLPYRRDLVGFFANVNGLSRTFPPF